MRQWALIVVLVVFADATTTPNSRNLLQQQQQAGRQADRDVRHQEVGISPANPTSGGLPAAANTPQPVHNNAGEVWGVPPPVVQQRQQRFVVSMRTAAQPVQAAFSNAMLAIQQRLQEQAAADAALREQAAAALREQAAAAGLRSVTSAPPQPQFLAIVVVPEQVHPHRSAPFQARRVQVTSQQQLQYVLAQLQADFGDAAGAARQQEFAAWLQRVGEGTEPTCPDVGEDFIRLPNEIVCGGGEREGTLQELIDGVYGELGNLQSDEARQEYIVERAILTPLNDDVDSVNELMTARMCARRDGGEEVESRVYRSADSVVRGEQTDFLYPTEFLNTLSMSGLPPHKLHLHVGCPIILLRNMSGGLANGTRLVVTRLMANVIQAKVATGPAKGQLVMLPRLNTVPSDGTNLPFALCRRQFPVRVAYAMTINKSQGQTLRVAGVYLPRSVFSHGQLYVAFSRVGIWEALKVLVVGGFHAATAAIAAGVYTKNVVYREVFQGVRR